MLDVPDAHADEPFEIGVVRLSRAQLCASILRGSGVQATVVADAAGDRAGAPVGPGMARIFVPRRQAAEALPLFDEITHG